MGTPEIGLKSENKTALRKGQVRPEDSNLLQGVDIDESLGMDQVDEQVRATPPPCWLARAWRESA